MLHSHRYRNRRLGDFLKELDLTEGHSTGIPTIQAELLKNGSSRATIETNDERILINVFIPIHDGCGDTVVLNAPQGDTQGDIQGDTQDDTQGDTEEENLDKWIENQIRQNPQITTEELAKMSKKGLRTIKHHIANMPHIHYVGSGYSGHWEVD